jgi:hypothetical protein
LFAPDARLAMVGDAAHVALLALNALDGPEE